MTAPLTAVWLEPCDPAALTHAGARHGRMPDLLWDAVRNFFDDRTEGGRSP
ncbi:hypothetical protein [Catenuloplanes indicus]|uniref:Uncharacterized protein n=1 Tax=Catenuloplanes indicus TaxID=137267 RepID=A0AAE3VV60_9ACTN|nr:hypothetical protein [Catenuloplanes indicus]MDQ0363787.1 hypothetical protein [Catenuloplanes indicus]